MLRGHELSYFDNTYLNYFEKQQIRKLKRKYEFYIKIGWYGRAEAIHRKAEKIRAKYGYSGGEDGNQYIPLENYCI